LTAVGRILRSFSLIYIFRNY